MGATVGSSKVSLTVSRGSLWVIFRVATLKTKNGNVVQGTLPQFSTDEVFSGILCLVLHVKTK